MKYWENFHTWVNRLPHVLSGVGILFGLILLGELSVYALGSEYDGFRTGVITSTPFIIGFIYAGYWLEQSTIPSEQYRRIARWWGGGILLTVLIIGSINISIRVMSLQIVIGTVRWSSAIGGGVGLTIGILEARAIQEAVEIERVRFQLQETQQEREKLGQFADIVSHDLRNPLSVARGYFDMSRDNIDDDYAEKIDRNLGRMEQMIEDLLTMSRAGITVKELEAVTLRTLATESWESAQTSTAELDLQMSEDITFNADRERLMHVFENIFRNAVDHNDSPLTIRVGVLETMENGVTDVTGFFIEDDGDGIPANEREAVFDHGYSTSDNGTGLGLSIVKQIVDAHGWDVSLTEADTGGVRFEFYVDNFTTETRAD